jgi:hypothetical protein
VAIQASKTWWLGQIVITTVSPVPSAGSQTSSARIPCCWRIWRPASIQAR